MMSNTLLSFTSGDESEEFFWRQVQQLPDAVHYARRPTVTDWKIGDAVAAASAAGVAVTELFTGYHEQDIVVIVANLNAGGRRPCLMLLKWYGEKNFIAGEFATSTEDDLRFYRETMLGAAPEPPVKEPVEDNGILIDFTYMGQNYPEIVTREITAPE